MKQQQNTAEKPQRINKLSYLLAREESEQVFSLLGHKCQSLSTAVIQLFKTEGTAHSHWKKKLTGVLCIVRDGTKKSYFLRIYCLNKNELVWEHELYETIDVHKARPFLLTFEGQDGNVALNFALEQECDDAFKELQIIQNRFKKRLEKRNRLEAENVSGSHVSDSRNKSGTVSTLGSNQNSNIYPSSYKPTFQTTSTGGVAVERKKKKVRKYTKADISEPTNFVHVSHVGWDAQKGFDLVGNEDDAMLKTFFAKAGVSKEILKDQETRDYIYNFVRDNKVIEKAKSESLDIPDVSPPPVVPSRHQNQNGNSNTQRVAPPLPTRQPATKQASTRQPPPPVPDAVAPTSSINTIPNNAPVRAPPPIRPPPITLEKANAAASIQAPPMAPPPPPPPPPPPAPMPPTLSVSQQQKSESGNSGGKSSTLPQVTDVRSALMESIRKGTALKHVDTTSLSTGSGDSRSELLSEIRHGFELKPVEARQISSSVNAPPKTNDSAIDTDALAHALRRALIDRGKFIHSSEDESDESSDNDREWDD